VFGSVQKAIGGHYTDRAGKRIEVVGVAEDGRYVSLTEDPQAAMFYPILQAPASGTWLIVRWKRDLKQASTALTQTIRGLDPGLPFAMRTWENELGNTLFPARMATMSLGVLGGLGAMLAITGIFGMAAYSVSKRLREFGIRIALGAQRRQVLQAALGRTFRILALGSAAGLLAGTAASSVLAYIVYQASPRDPMVLAGVVLTMLVVGLLAAWIPAMRALAADPSILLREE
jgi:ABC-type antimicrobial peptide transport system permease subunit